MIPLVDHKFLLIQFRFWQLLQINPATAKYTFTCLESHVTIQSRNGLFLLQKSHRADFITTKILIFIQLVWHQFNDHFSFSNLMQMSTAEWPIFFCNFSSHFAWVLYYNSLQLFVIICRKMSIFKVLISIMKFWGPMLSCAFNDGSLDRCLVDILNSFCCWKLHLELTR